MQINLLKRKFSAIIQSTQVSARKEILIMEFKNGLYKLEEKKFLVNEFFSNKMEFNNYLR